MKQLPNKRSTFHDNIELLLKEKICFILNMKYCITSKTYLNFLSFLTYYKSILNRIIVLYYKRLTVV